MYETPAYKCIVFIQSSNVFYDILLFSILCLWQNQQNDLCDQCLLCAQWVAKDPSFLHADSKDSDQTERMPRLIWVFAGRTCHFVGFVMRRLKLLKYKIL